MSALHVLDRLPEWALGVLPDAESRTVGALLATWPPCAADSVARPDGANVLGRAPPPLPPSPTIRARVLAAIRAKGRLAQHTALLAKFFAVTDEKARALLDAIDEPAAWDAGPVEHVALMHFNGGPQYAQADTGLVRFPKGIAWPLHKHIGDEYMLIIEGGIQEDDGTVHGPGSVLFRPAGSQHAFDILPETDCVSGVILFEGIEMPPGTRVTM